MAEACDRYAISLEEFMQWKTDYEERGLVGLHTPTQRRLTIVH